MGFLGPSLSLALGMFPPLSRDIHVFFALCPSLQVQALSPLPLGITPPNVSRMGASPMARPTHPGWHQCSLTGQAGPLIEYPSLTPWVSKGHLVILLRKGPPSPMPTPGRTPTLDLPAPPKQDLLPPPTQDNTPPRARPQRRKIVSSTMSLT